MDSASFISEPPDIKNWYSSYEYESPDLNSLEDFDGAGENVPEEECEAKSRGNETPRHADDVSIADDTEDCKVHDVLQSSLCSEAPDLQNWFSSYVYESPLLEPTDNLVISELQEMKYNEHNTDESCNQSNKNAGDFKESANLQCQSGMSAIIAKCTSLVKDTNLDDKSIKKVDLNPTSALINMSDSEKVSGENFPFHEEHTIKMLRKTASTSDARDNDDGDAKPEGSFLGKEKNNTGSGIAASAHNSIEMDNRVKNRQGMVSLSKISSETLDLVVSDQKSYEKTCLKADLGKENEDPKLRDDGFVCVRKKIRQENAKSVITNIQLQCRGNDSRLRVKHEEVRATKKVLSESSNFRSSDAIETKGKWRCPQKSKPDIGTPLKQLRLEQWVRKIT